MSRLVSSILDSLPPEGRLIADCISLSSGRETRARVIAEAARDIDWERVFEYAVGHFVVPQVHSAVAECAGLVPPKTSKSLRHAHACNAMLQRNLARELARVSAGLASVGVSSIALKGPALAMQAYGELEARQCGDLDILVRASDLPLITTILEEHGYRADTHQRPADIRFFDLLEDKFVSKRCEIDLHLDFLPNYFPFPDREATWRDAVNVRLEDGEVKTIAPADQLLFSILHATKHGWGWGSLRSMCDIAELTATGLVDWEHTEERMARFGCRRICHLGAVLSHAFVGAGVPRPVLDRATSDKKVMRLAAGIARTLFPVPDLLRSGWLFQLSAIEGFGWRARYLRNRGLRPTIDEWESLPLPRALYWVYYLTRPARLLIHHGARFVPRRAQAASE
jgi:hypothetical protein